MTKNKTGFWRGFTWRRFFMNFFIFLPVYLLVDILVSLPDWQEIFTVKKIIGLFVKTGFNSFLFALWFEPGVDNRKMSNQQKLNE